METVHWKALRVWCSAVFTKNNSLWSFGIIIFVFEKKSKKLNWKLKINPLSNSCLCLLSVFLSPCKKKLNSCNIFQFTSEKENEISWKNHDFCSALHQWAEKIYFFHFVHTRHIICFIKSMKTTPFCRYKYLILKISEILPISWFPWI